MITSYIIPFIVLLGALVFFHELGHFLMARLFGVGVVTFSLGFGPKIFKRKIGETEYCISIVPLGGYVKMIGEDPTEETEPELSAVSFSHKPLWQRALIVGAGPAFNVVLAFFIFLVIFAIGYPRLQPVIGSVRDGSPAAEARLYPGDRIQSVAGEEIQTWSDLERSISGGEGKPVELTVERGGETFSRTVDPTLTNSPNLFGQLKPTFSIGVSTTYDLPIVGVSDPATWAGTVGLRTGDRITKINGEPVPMLHHLRQALAGSAGEQVEIELSRPGETESGSGEEPPAETVRLSARVPEGVDAATVLDTLGIENPDLFVLSVQEDSPAAKAGFRDGDRILTVDGQPVEEQIAFLKAVRGAADKNLTVTVRRAGEVHELTVVPELARRETETGDAVQSGRIGVLIGSSQARGFMAPERHLNPIKLIGAASRETAFWTKVTVQAFYYIVTGSLSTKSVGGPIRIAKMAGDSAKAGLLQYVFLMAVISLNLAIINLVPIPVFDGGHLLLFSLEGLKGKPLNLRTLQVVSWFGLAFIVFLIVFLFYNDLAFIFPGLRGSPVQ